MASVYSTDNRIEIKGIPFQGHGIFKDYYTLFRGKGYTLNNTDRGVSGLYNSLANFFTANYVLIYNISENAKEVGEIIRAPQTKVLNVISSNPKALEVIASSPEGVKASVTEKINSGVYFHDLSIYRFPTTTFPSDKSSSAETFRSYLEELMQVMDRMMIGSFLVLIIPRDSENLDLLLSSIEVVGGSLYSLVYNGMVLFEPLKLPVWIFRRENLNVDIIAARTNMARNRLRRHLKVFENVVDDLAPENTSTGIVTEPLFQKILRTKVTPSHEIIRLFEILRKNFPREIINSTVAYQLKYEAVLAAAAATNSNSSLMPLLNGMLYDFCICVGRKLLNSTSSLDAS